MFYLQVEPVFSPACLNKAIQITSVSSISATIIINFRLPLVVFANIKFNIKKILQSYIKKHCFSISFIIFSHTLSINLQYGI